VRIHARIVQPVLDISLVFLGLPLVLRREQPRLFVAIGWGLLAVCGFAAAVITCHALGDNYLLSPVLATWCPLFLFLPLAVLISRPLQE
jgi:lipopolysaccharide export system permease protein